MRLLEADFCRAAGAHFPCLNAQEEIIRVFELMDEGGKGKITFQDLKRVAGILGIEYRDEEFVAMIEEFDMDGDDAVNQDEFTQICLG